MISRLRIFYFLAYGGVGIWLAYFAPYLRGLGFSGEQIGAVSLAQQLVAVPAALAWGTLGDRLGSPLRALRICSAAAAAAVLALPLVRTPLPLGALLVVAAAFGPGIVPLVDSIAVRVAGEGYARTRLFGSIGFLIAAQSIGLLLAWRGDRPADVLMPLAYVAFVAINAMVARTFPDAEPRSDRPHWRDAITLLRDKRLLFVLALGMIHWAALGPYHLMFGVLVRDQGLPSTVTGSALALGVVAEVVALAAFPALASRFSLRALFAAASAGSMVRWLLLFRAHGSIELVSLQLLHAFTFGVWWGCAIEAMQRIVPERLRATGQALVSAVVFGAGNSIGYALAGVGYDRFGSVAPLFLGAAAAECAALLLLLLPLTPSEGRA
jgi:PPP family 3-phenylpropionic acid transporter